MKKHKLKFGGHADAYLEWAFHTGFRDYGTLFERRKNKHVGLLVQWRDDIANRPPRYDRKAVKIPPAYKGFEHAAMAVKLKWLLTNPEALTLLGAARRIELTSPIAASYHVGRPSLVEHGYPGVDTPEGLLLGCIDDMFPLANAAFFRDDANRIVRFWDQNDAGAVAGKLLATRSDDPHGTDFGYGRELVQNSGPAAIATSKDLRDESAYYERMGLRALRRNTTHGAHVLDLFAGPLPARSRISASRDFHHGEDGSSCKPPSRQVANDPASRAPIVLVELPDYAIEDPSGRWLGRNILDGLHYINQVAGPAGNGIQRVVVNISWGPQTGPRDGTSLLEQAMDELVYRAGRQFDIVLAAGNSRTARAHAQFKARQGCEGLVWCVPPALEAPSHLEIWWPGVVVPADAKITVTSPAGTVVKTVGQGIFAAPGNSSWGVTQVRCGDRMMALLALAPTFVRDGAAGPAQHGRWLISVEKVKTKAKTQGLVHVNVARTNHNMGAKRRSPASYLWDPSYEAFRHGRQARKQAPPANCLVQPTGTLSGIATGSSTHVASGYQLADALPSTYASQGPCETRAGPNFCYPTDESAVLLGIRAGGVRSGTVTRLVGTSAASPQLARESTNVEPIPKPPNDMDPRLGGGRR